MEKSKKLIQWYHINKRDLPWRNTNNPYYIWVSEIMLQQTRVEAVIPYYNRFIKMLPTIYDLSIASEDELHKLWEGLGYYSRVRNMQKAAITCVQKYHGFLPETYDELILLKGIGPYTAGAIASFAFHEKVSAVDGNVLRVYSRLYNVHKDIMLDSTKKEISQLVLKDMEDDAYYFNQAVMELGACICIPSGAPKCNQCPLVEDCKAYQYNTIEDLPIKKVNKKRKKEKYTLVINVCNAYVLIHKRAAKGLLASLYEFELMEGHKTKKDYPDGIYLGKYKHIFSHIEWDLKGFLVESDNLFQKEGYQWVKISELKNIYPIPTAFKKYCDKLYEIYE